MEIDLEPIWFRWTRRESELSDERDQGSPPATHDERDADETDAGRQTAERPTRRSRPVPHGLGEAWYRKGARR
jgi:hypothetical protein